MRIEQIEKRTLNSKHFKNDDGTFTSEIHIGHIHHLDKVTKKLEDTDVSLVDKGTFWEMRKAGYEVEIPRNSAGNIRFFVNKFDKPVYNTSQDKVPEMIKQTNFLGQDSIDYVLLKVQGQPAQPVNGILTKPFQVLYPAILPNIDFRVSAGRNSFRKEIILKTKPVIIGDFLEIEFTTNKNFSGTFKDKFKIGDIHFRKAMAVDVTGKNFSDVELVVSLNKIIKRIPKTFLDTALYPVTIDPTDSFFSGAGDGFVNRENTVSWADVHDTVTGTSANTVATTAEIQDYSVGASKGVRRIFLPFDSSAIPATNTVTAAEIRINITDACHGTGFNEFGVVQTSQPSETALTTSDFDKCGAITNPTEGAARTTISAVTCDANNTVTLNATGRGFVKKSGQASNCGVTNGFTCLGLRGEADMENVEPTVGTTTAICGAVCSNNTEFLRILTSEEAGTANDPQLTVTHSSAAVVTPNLLTLQVG